MDKKNLHKKIIGGGILFLFVGMSIIPITGSIETEKPGSVDGGVLSTAFTRDGITIYVDDDNTEGPWDGTQENPYQNIQDGIDNASTDDTVYVFNGTYYVANIWGGVTVNKRIHLIGQNRDDTIIIGGPHTLWLEEDQVFIDGFTLTSVNPPTTNVAITIDCSNSTIRNCHIIDILGYGISTWSGTNNTIYHNNFIDIFSSNVVDLFTNNWDNGYPCGGNYWDDYEQRYPDAMEIDESGIWDTPYNLTSGNQDRYPLMFPWNNTVFVDDDRPPDWYDEMHVKTVQEGVDNVSSGNTVYVYNGTYYEQVVVDKTIDLIGKDKNNTIIDGQGERGDVVYISADFVNITGFTIQNSGISLGPVDAGVEVKANNSIISGNLFIHNRRGVFLYGSRDCIIANNYMSNNAPSGGSSKWESHDGIYAWDAYNNQITGNMFTDHRTSGIFMAYGSENTISENTITDNQYGVYLSNSYQNTVSGNNISDNDDEGILIEGPDDPAYNNISGNRLTNDNIGLRDTTYNIVKDNIFNLKGITISGGELQYWNTHNIQGNSMIGGPIRYYKNTNDVIVTTDTKQVILANCTNFNIQSLNINDVDPGVQLGFSSGNTISGGTLTRIELVYSSSNTISDNTITDTSTGIDFYRSFDNIIFNNTITNNNEGIHIERSSNNDIFANNITNNNDYGIFCSSNYNHIYHNNFISNDGYNAYDTGSNTWDNGYPSGGNYWDDYTGTDGNDDGIGDTSYPIPGGDNEDRYPLMDPWTGPLPPIVFVDDDQAPGWYDSTHVHTIQEGINNATAGEPVYVYNGVYYEHLIADKQVNLIGQSRENVIVDGSGNGDVITVSADWTCIKGFTIQNSGGTNSGVVVSAENTTIYGNIITDNNYGISIQGSYGNSQIYHNNFITNTQHASDAGTNSWDNGYPSGGNYWDDYNGSDVNDDGIGDIPYLMPEGSNHDRYPLINPWEGTPITPLCGDANGDGVVDLGDIVHLINYLFRGQSPPKPVMCIGDVNCDGTVDLGDIVYLIGYLFRGGPAPCPECCG